MLRLEPVAGEPSSYTLVAGEVVVGVLRLELESGSEGARWYFSIFAFHLAELGTDNAGSAANIGDAFAMADRRWGEMIAKLGLGPA